MAYIQGEARGQQRLFPSTLDDLIPANHVCRVIEAFVDSLDFVELGFVRAEPAETGRPGYDPRDLLKLYLYGYLHQVRSSRCLEAECRRNVEVMWLLAGLSPDYKSIAEFRRMHGEAVKRAGAELVRFARGVGLVRGEWVAIDGSKFRAVSSASGVRERNAVERYLSELEQADESHEIVIDQDAAALALEKLQSHREAEACFMKTNEGKRPAYNVQTALDADQGLIVAHQVTTEGNDLYCLQPMAEAAKDAVGAPETMHVVADTGYSNPEQVAHCEQQGIVAHVPPHRSKNNQGDGGLFDPKEFIYHQQTDTLRCPAGKTLKRIQLQKDRQRVAYKARPQDCCQCPLKQQCTQTNRRTVYRMLQEEVLQRMQLRATREAMRLRRSIVELPFAFLKYRIFGHPRFLLRGVAGAETEISLGVLGYNLKRLIRTLGGRQLVTALAE